MTVMRSFLLITLTVPAQSTPFIAHPVGTSSQFPYWWESIIVGVYFSQMSIIIYFCLGFRCCPFYWGVHYSGMFTRQELTYMQVIGRRGVTSCYHSSKISESQQSLLTEMAICIVERWKKVYATILFLQGAITHTKVLSIFSFSLFSFPQYLQDHGLLRSRNFVTMVTWCNDFSSLLHIGVHTRVWMCSGEAGGMEWGCVILGSSMFFII